jgi:hypothetical protein
MRDRLRTAAIVLLAFGTALASAPLRLSEAAVCSADQRELTVTNSSTGDIWVGGGGGALRSVCVVDVSTSCLAAQSTINANTGSCECGPNKGTLACPGTSQPLGPKTNGALNCQCASDAECGPGAGCNPNSGLCYFVLPEPAKPKPFKWKLAVGETADFCFAPASVSWHSMSIPSAVWWSGGVFARRGCKADGTRCVTGDCGAKPNANCPAGIGGTNPATLAEFTLQREENDFYDITLINGANIREKMEPIPAATATPGAVADDYWCKAPGAGTTTVAGSDCDWDLGKYVAEVPYPNLNSMANFKPLLLHSSRQCDAAATPNGCPAGFQCSGAPGACFKQCTTDSECAAENLSCLPGGNGKNYCQCNKELDCADKGYCGTQFVPGVGPGQVFLQQCGKFAGWWTVDDFCANQNNKVGPFDCGKLIKDGDGTSQTNIASLYGCTIRGSESPGNGTSCYNKGDATTYPKTCCGCATNDQSDSSLGQFWPKNATGVCYGNDTTWASQIQPFLVNLKRACPTAYSYPYDDVTSTYQCRAASAINLLGYKVTFKNLVKPVAP